MASFGPVSPSFSAPDRPHLVRAIGRWDLTASVVNSVIGSSIFGLPALLAGLTGAWSPIAFLLGGVGIMTIVLCHAEVASRFTEPGGPYLYSREAFGPFVGVQAGWLSFCSRVAATGANLNIFADYLAQLQPLAGERWGRLLTIVVVMASVTVINVVGVRTGACTVDLLMVAKLLPLVFLGVMGLSHLRGDVLASQRVISPDWTQAILLLVTAYGGFEAALIPAGELKDPRRDAAFALLTGMGVVVALYMMVQLAVVGIVPHAAEASAPLAAALGVLLGGAGVAMSSLAAMASTFGWTVGSVLNSPRILYSMAERGELPAVFARVHPRFRTPHVAIVVYAAAGLTFAAFGSFAANATLSAVVRIVTYGLASASLLVFRRRRLDPPPFRVPMASVVAPAAIVFCLWLLVTRTLSQAWILLAMVAVGAAMWRFSASGRKGARAS